MQEISNKQDVATVGLTRQLLTHNNPLVMSVSHLLKDLQNGRIYIRWPDGTNTEHGQGGPSVSLTLNNTMPIRQLFFGGHNGFVETYFEGHWTCSDLTTLFSIVMQNESLFSGTLAGKWLARIKNVFYHFANRNSLSGSRRNISFHYDLGNSFYRLWLDPTMTYSSALFEDQGLSLERAQQAKMQRIGQLIAPTKDSRVLEIGCGWGALGNHLVSTSGCSVYGVSLSQQQLDFANQRYADARLTFQYQDYREIEGRYDHIVSIEMFEAVGMAYWRTYFGKLASLLKDQGSVLLQVITIDEQRFDGYRKTPDFIQRYVFPGGMLPTKTHLYEFAESAGFVVTKAHWFGSSYAETLRQWRETFESSLSDVRALGYDEAFIRLWRYYLSYCEVGFRHGSTDVGFVVLTRDDASRAAP